jgi:hypothetical protein
MASDIIPCLKRLSPKMPLEIKLSRALNQQKQCSWKELLDFCIKLESNIIED